MLELAARSIGGLCSRSLRFGVGVSLEEVILRHALGLPLDDLRREAAASGVMMLPIPRAGVLREVRGQDDARAVPGIAGLEISIGPTVPSGPCPRAIATSASCLPAARRPRRSSTHCERPTSGSRSTSSSPSAGERSAGAAARG